MHFVWRARDERRRFLLGDLELRKTRNGVKEFSSERYFNHWMYTTGGKRCPVKFFKGYLVKRPAEMRNPDDLFYLAVKKPTTDVWFKKQPLGLHSLGNFMKSMARAH